MNCWREKVLGYFSPCPLPQGINSRLERRKVRLRGLLLQSAQADFALWQPGIYSLGQECQRVKRRKRCPRNIP